MNKRPEVHTVKHGDGWANRRAGSDRVSKVYPTKRERSIRIMGFGRHSQT